MDSAAIERLIECVRGYTFLYDLSHKEYKNVTLKLAVWESIGNELNQSGEAVKNKWKTIRDGYTKYKKQTKGTTGSGKKNINYLWASQLAFLDSINVQRASSSNVVVTESISSPQSPLIQTPTPDNSNALTPPPCPPAQMSHPELSANNSSNTPTTSGISTISSQNVNGIPANTRKKNDDDVDKILRFLNTRKRKEHDVIDNLFLSYADTFKKFPAREQAIVKLELAKLFSNMELKLLNNSDSQSQYPLSPVYSNISSVDNLYTFQELNSPPSQPVNLSGQSFVVITSDDNINKNVEAGSTYNVQDNLPNLSLYNYDSIVDQ